MRIGPIQLSSPFCQAGLAGYSDRAMRLVARRRGCAYAVTEALLDVIMLAGGMGLKKSIDINEEDHPVAGQIIGSDGETMARAAKILADYQYDVIDLNFACPVKKIKNKARGGHMLMDTARGIGILQAVRDALPAHVPTTVSLRRGFDDSAESVERFEELIEAAWKLGYSAIRVHGRTVEQKYQGRANWNFLKELKERHPTRTIIGSGDVFNAHDAVRMLRETGVDVVWIARGAIGNPWVFRQAMQLLELEKNAERETLNVELEKEDSALDTGGSGLAPPTIDEQRAALVEHFGMAMEIHGEQLAGRRMRKMGIKYSRFHPEAAVVKSRFINVHSLREWNAVLDEFYSGGGPGVWPVDDAANEVNGSASGDANGADLQSCEVD